VEKVKHYHVEKGGGGLPLTQGGQSELLTLGSMGGRETKKSCVGRRGSKKEYSKGIPRNKGISLLGGAF